MRSPREALRAALCSRQVRGPSHRVQVQGPISTALVNEILNYLFRAVNIQISLTYKAVYMGHKTPYQTFIKEYNLIISDCRRSSPSKDQGRRVSNEISLYNQYG